MSIKVTLEFASIEEAAAFLSAVDGGAKAPKKSSRKKTEEPTGAGAGAAAADPVPGVTTQSPMTPPAAAAAPAPAAQAAPAAQPAAPAPAAAPAAQVDQAALLQAFTQLGQTKGRDAIAALLAEFGASMVVGPPGQGVPSDRWAEAIERARQVLAS